MPDVCADALLGKARATATAKKSRRLNWHILLSHLNCAAPARVTEVALASSSIFRQCPDDRGNDRAGDAAAHELTGDRADVHGCAGGRKHGDQQLQDLTAD